MADDLIPAPRLVHCPHPLLAAASREVRCQPFLPDESIAAYLDRVGIAIDDRPVALALNDRLIPRQDWATTFPAAGDLITIRALVQRARGGGSNPLRTILTIAVLIYAPQLAIKLGVGQLGTALIVAGGTLLVNAIAPLPKPPNPGDGGAPSPTYSLSGASNRARPFEPLPLVLGTHRIFPDIGAKPYTEFRGEDQYLYVVFNFGLADITLSDFRIGDTPLAQFDGYELQESGADGALTLFPANVDTVEGAALTQSAGYISKTSSPNATALAVDITGALFTHDKSGKVQPHFVDLEIEYRAIGSGPWLPFLDAGTQSGIPTWQANTFYSPGLQVRPTAFNGHKYARAGVIDVDGVLTSEYTGATEPIWPTSPGAFVADGVLGDGWNEAGAISAAQVQLINGSRRPLRVSFRRNVPLGQYEVRMRRLTADEPNHRRNVSETSWSVLRTYQPDTANYVSQKRVALAIKASGQLQGTLDNFSAVGSARVPVWNGTAFVTQVSSNPAWLFLYFARGKTDGSGRRLFGGLLPDSRIDIEGLKAFGAFCDAKQLTFNAVIDRTLHCGEVLNYIANCGRGGSTWASGKLGVVWDEPNQPVVAVFGMGNIRRDTFSVEYITGKLADEVVIEFVNPDLNWQADTVRVTVPGVTSPQRVAHYQLFGCTNRDMAGKAANLLAAQQVWRRRRASWESDFEGMVVQRGDVVTLSHDLTQWGYSGRLIAGNGTSVTLDRKVPFAGAGPWYIGVVFPNGYYQIFDVQSATGDRDVINLTEAWPATDGAGNTLYTPSADPNHPPYDYKYVFEPAATPGKKMKIVGIQPVSEHYVRITATDEEPGYYASETNPYLYAPPANFEAQLPTLVDLQITDTLIHVGLGYATIISLAWDVSGTYGSATIRANQNGMPLGVIGTTTERRFEFQGPAAGALDIELLLRSPSGRHHAAGRVRRTYVIQGKSRPPEDVTGFSASQNGRFVVFKWNEVPDVDRDGYEIRRTPQTVTDADAAWEVGMLVVEAEQGTQMTSGTVPPGSWKFTIKAKDTSSPPNYSELATAFDLDVVNALDIIYDRQQAPDWIGTKTDCLVHWTGVLVPESTRAANAHTNAELFEQFVPYPVASFSYEAPEIDLGFDSDVRVYADVDAALGRGRTGIVDPELTLDYRTAAGAYDGFEPWSIGDVRARYLKLKISVDTADGVSYVSGTRAVADTDEFGQTGTGVSAVGGMVIAFPQPYHVLADFGVTPEGSTAYLATYTELTTTGARVWVWNITGGQVPGVNFRWNALGA